MWWLLISVLVMTIAYSRKVQDDVYHQPDSSRVLTALRQSVKRGSVSNIFYLTRLGDYLDLFQPGHPEYEICSILRKTYNTEKEGYMAEYVNRRWSCHNQINVSFSDNNAEILYYAILVDKERDENTVSLIVVNDS